MKRNAIHCKGETLSYAERERRRKCLNKCVKCAPVWPEAIGMKIQSRLIQQSQYEWYTHLYNIIIKSLDCHINYTLSMVHMQWLIDEKVSAPLFLSSQIEQTIVVHLIHRWLYDVSIIASSNLFISLSHRQRPVVLSHDWTEIIRDTVTWF